MEVKIMTVSNQKLGTAALAALVVSAMIGGGISIQLLPHIIGGTSGCFGWYLYVCTFGVR